MGRSLRILRQTALESGYDRGPSPDRVEEIEAVNLAIESAERDDLVVLLVDKPAEVWQELEKRVSLVGS